MTSFAWPSLWMAFVYTTLYAVVSRLPMIFAMVYMVYELNLQGAVPAIIFCGYCIARLLAAVGIASYFGIPSMFLGTFTGVLGYAIILIWPRNGIVFGVMIGLTGFTETVTGIDTFLKIECLIEDYPLEMQQLLFRVHLVAATLGSFIAYLGGGMIYEAAGVVGICLLGMGVSALNIIVLAVYCCMRGVLCRTFFLYANDVLQETETEEHNFILQLNPALAATKARGTKDLNGRAVLPTPDRVTAWAGQYRKSEGEKDGTRGSQGRREQRGSMMSMRISELPRLSGMTNTLSARSGRKKSSLVSQLSMLDLLLFQAKEEKEHEWLSGESVEIKDRKTNKVKQVSSTRGLGTFNGLSGEEQRKVRLAMLALVLSFYVTVLPISNNFGVLALFWQAQWQQGTSVSGFIMAAGELGGLLSLQVLAHKRVFRLQILRSFRKPMNLIAATLAASTVVALVTVPLIQMSALGSVGVHVINVLLHSFCSECAAAWSPHDVYAFWIGRCYLSKRLSNATVAAATINLFFMEPLWPPRPYVFVASVVSVWSSCLFAVFFYLGLLPWQQDRDVVTAICSDDLACTDEKGSEA